MSTLNQIKEGISKAWDSLTVGWRELRELAGDALTRFQPKSSREGSDSPEDRIVKRASRWGLLAAEVADTGDEIQVTMEIPGLKSDDLIVEAQDDVLVVRGEKKLSREETKGHYVLMERAYGAFERAVRLPAKVQDDGASARYRAGVLTVTLPKAQGARSNRIAVETQ